MLCLGLRLKSHSPHKGWPGEHVHKHAEKIGGPLNKLHQLYLLRFHIKLSKYLHIRIRIALTVIYLIYKYSVHHILLSETYR